jgi:hypothetical protein
MCCRAFLWGRRERNFIFAKTTRSRGRAKEALSDKVALTIGWLFDGQDRICAQPWSCASDTLLIDNVVAAGVAAKNHACKQSTQLMHAFPYFHAAILNSIVAQFDIDCMFVVASF